MTKTVIQNSTIELRPAHPDEADVVRWLAQLDDAPMLAGEVLLALVDGQAVAALSLWDGRVVANPFVPTEDAVALLRLRALHVSRRPLARRGAGKGRWGLPKLPRPRRGGFLRPLPV